MKTCLIALVGLVCLPALASQEKIIQPYKVTVSADAGKPFGDVTVEITTDRKADNPKITAIRLKVDGEWQDVPKKAFTDLDSPLLNETEIRTEVGRDDSPWLYIYFEVSHRDNSGTWRPKQVHIGYHKGRFEQRSITTPTSDTESKWDKMEL